MLLDVATWREGCSVAGDRAGGHPSDCFECTETLVAAVEHRARSILATLGVRI
jgi:hypothetical protein